MAIAFVNQEARNTWPGSGVTYTYTESPVIQDGNLAVIIHTNSGTTATVASIAQNSGTVTWAQNVEGTTGSANSLFSAFDCQSAGNTSTLTLDASPGSDASIFGTFAEFSGLRTVSDPFLAGSVKQSASGTSHATNTVTPANGIETLLIAYIRGADINGEDAAWTALTNPSPTTYRAMYRIVTGDGSTTYSCTFTTSVNRTPILGIAAFEAPSSGSDVTITPTGFGLSTSQGTMDVRADTTIYQIPGYELNTSLGAPTIVAGGNVQFNASGFGLSSLLGTPVVAIDSIVVSPLGFPLFTFQGNPTVVSNGTGSGLSWWREVARKWQLPW